MIVLAISPHKVKGVQAKKGLLGAVESYWSEKSASKKLISNGVYASVEQLTSSLKDTLSVNGRPFRDTEVVLILDHTVYTLYRTEIPLATDKTAYHVYLKDAFSKAHSTVDVNEYSLEMFVREFENKKIGFVYALPKAQLTTVALALELLEYKLSYVVPEHLAYYMTFERTVRLDKQEHILYVTYEGSDVSGFAFDSYGPVTTLEPWSKQSVPHDELEAYLKQKASDYATKIAKLHRIVITGSDTEKLRQDTFTKHVGVWTNPMKRIVPHFYQDYLSEIQGKAESGVVFPVLSYSETFGGFIALKDAKAFPYAKIGSRTQSITYEQPITHSSKTSMATTEQKRSFRFPKEILLFLAIFLVTFGVFYVIASSRGGGVTLPFASAPTATPTPLPTEPPPTPTPTVEVKKDEVKVKVLNGTGVAGQASGVKTLLEGKGYVGVSTGNADRYDYEMSEVQFATGKDYLKDTVLADVKDLLPNPKITAQAEGETADVVIIIGKDAQ